MCIRDSHRRVRLVDLMEQRSGKLAFAGSETFLLAQLYQLGIVAHVDDAESFVLCAEPQRHFAGRSFQVLDIELAAARGVEERRERLLEDLRRCEAACIEILEA